MFFARKRAEQSRNVVPASLSNPPQLLEAVSKIALPRLHASEYSCREASMQLEHDWNVKQRAIYPMFCSACQGEWFSTPYRWKSKACMTTPMAFLASKNNNLGNRCPASPRLHSLWSAVVESFVGYLYGRVGSSSKR